MPPSGNLLLCGTVGQSQHSVGPNIIPVLTYEGKEDAQDGPCGRTELALLRSDVKIFLHVNKG